MATISLIKQTKETHKVVNNQNVMVFLYFKLLAMYLFHSDVWMLTFVYIKYIYLHKNLFCVFPFHEIIRKQWK